MEFLFRMRVGEPVKQCARSRCGPSRRASIRAAYQAAVADGKSDASDATERLMEAVDRAAREACLSDEECQVDFDDDEASTNGDTATAAGKPRGVSSEALMLALRDHGAELAPAEWLSLIRPVAGRAAAAGKKGVFVDNAALAAILQTPAGGSFSSHVDNMMSTGENPSSSAAAAANVDGDGGGDASYDWNAIAKASFERILEESRAREGADADASDATEATVTFEDVADMVCAPDGSEELCRVTLKEEFDEVDTSGSVRRGGGWVSGRCSFNGYAYQKRRNTYVITKYKSCRPFFIYFSVVATPRGRST